jgi:hypothetical protein
MLAIGSRIDHDYCGRRGTHFIKKLLADTVELSAKPVERGSSLLDTGAMCEKNPVDQEREISVHASILNLSLIVRTWNIPLSPIEA